MQSLNPIASERKKVTCEFPLPHRVKISFFYFENKKMFSSNTIEPPAVEAYKAAMIQMLSPPATQADVEDTVASTPPTKKAKLAEKTKEESSIESMELANTTKQASGQQGAATGGKKKNEEKSSSSKEMPASSANGESKGKKKPPQ